MLTGKKILVAVTGSIAAYKSAYLVRQLVQHGAEVRVVMSPGALDFVTPLTFATLSGNPVASDFTEDPDKGTWTNHVEMGLWADLMIIAPLSSNTMSKMASAQSDNFLLATYLSARCPVMVAPAMDLDMFMHPATQANLQKLISFGHLVVEPEHGELASGLVGKGRMAEPEHIVAAVIQLFNPALPLLGKKAMVTAGPTYERLDPVRFIGNFASGKMGFELAESLAALGAEVTLISGPSHQQLKSRFISRIDVESAQQMYEASVVQFAHSDIAIMAAAVADYRPAHIADQKIKKDESTLTIELEKTKDIAAELGKIKQSGQFLVGFALETENEKEHAKQKLIKKNLDLIVLNSLRDDGAGFGTETNKISLLSPGNNWLDFGLMPKSRVASIIAEEIVKLLKA